MRISGFSVGDGVISGVVTSFLIVGMGGAGLWACMTGSLIIILIVAVTDVHFYFANKKQAQGLKIIEPVDGVDSSVSLLPLRTYRECRVTDLDFCRTNSDTPTRWKVGMHGRVGGCFTLLTRYERLTLVKGMCICTYFV